MKNIITRRRFNIVSMFTIVILLANLLIVNFVNKSYADRIPVKYDLRAEIGDISNTSNKQLDSLKDSAIIQLKSHILLGKKDGKYTSYSDDTLNKLVDIEKDLDYKVKGIFPLYKEVNANGVKYYKDTETEASESNINEHRAALKHIIMSKGGIVAYISKNGIESGLNNSGKVCNSKELTTAMGDLAVVIVGWDDDFSKDNFSDSHKPTSNGAFIVQSYNESLYVSYEDIYIENNLRYIDSVQELEEHKSEDNIDNNENNNNDDKKESNSEEQKSEPEQQDNNQEPKENEDKDVKKEEPAQEIVQEKEPTEQDTKQNTKQDDIAENKEPQEHKTIIPEKPEDLEVEDEPSIPTETTKVVTGNDALEVDTSSVKEQPAENNKINNDVPRVAKTNNVEYVDPQTVNGKLPQTGSYTEIYLIIAIATIMFMAFIVHSLKNVIKVDKYSL